MNDLGTLGRLAAAAARHPSRVLVLAICVTALSAFAASHLPIHTSRNALFPKDEPTLKRLDAFLQRFGSAADLLVVVDGADREVLEEFASTLASRLRGRPEVREASERLDTDFLFDRAYLMVPAEALRQAVRALERVGTTHSPLWTEPSTLPAVLDSVEQWLRDPPPISEADMGLTAAQEVLARLDVMLQEWLRFLRAPDVPQDLAWERLMGHPEVGRFLSGRGYFATRDGKALVVFVSRENPSSEFEVLDPFIRAVRAETEALRAEYQARGGVVPRVGLTGLPATEHEEYAAVQSDIVLVVSTAAAFIIVLVLAWMRSLRRALVIFIPMGLGTVWNLGLTVFTVGHLTLLTASFTAILFGLGVDYGIFLTSRVLEEVPTPNKVGRDALALAIGRATQASARGILTAAGTTVLIFLSLMAVPFQGFRELGIVAASGVALVVIATLVVGPALSALMPPLTRKPRVEHRPHSPLSLSRTTSAWVAGASVLTAGIGLVVGAQLPFDYDVLNLLPRGSEAARLQRWLVAESDFQPEVVLVTARDLPEARRLSEALKNIPMLSGVQTVVDLFPEDADERVSLAKRLGDWVSRTGLPLTLERQGPSRITSEDALRLSKTLVLALEYLDEVQDQAFSAGHEDIVQAMERIRTRLGEVAEELRSRPEIAAARTEAFFDRLLAAARRACEVLVAWRDARPLSPADLPVSLRDRFFAADGSVALYAYPRFSVYQPGMLDALMDQVYQVAPEATGFPATHRVLSRMAVESFRLGSIVAMMVALVTIGLAVRSIRGFVSASLPLVVGVGWMLGGMATLGLSFNYANIVGVPMVMALAVDYGVWFAHRRREHLGFSGPRPTLPGCPSPWETASIASRAIGLAAGTTFAGLGAIMLGRYQGVASLGACVTIGLFCCFMAARLVAPAVAHWLEGLTFTRAPRPPRALEGGAS